LCSRPKGITSCEQCKTIKVLEPSKVPGSCEQCGKVDLLPENFEAWELITDYCSMIETDFRGKARVDYMAASWVLDKEFILDKPAVMRKFEAFCNGING